MTAKTLVEAKSKPTQNNNRVNRSFPRNIYIEERYKQCQIGSNLRTNTHNLDKTQKNKSRARGKFPQKTAATMGMFVLR